MRNSSLLLATILLGFPVFSPTRAAEPSPAIGLKLVAEGFSAPIDLASLPDGSGRLLVADQAGVIYVIGRDGQRAETPFLDVRSRMVTLNQGMEERGITGIALHPKFKSNHKIYVVYSSPLRKGAPADWNNTMRISEFRADGKALTTASLDSERVVLEIDKPDWNHNSGRIAFGPDGCLYASIGDGGAPNDVGTRGHAPEGNGQNVQTLLGKMLRINVDKGNPYFVPKDNPFADGKNGRPEIYAYGLRNPWGFSFDRGGSHELVLADVGQDRWEEVNLIVRGGNYGWRLREGFDGFDPKNPRTAPAEVPKVGTDGKPLIDPVLVYKTQRSRDPGPDSFGACITGGYFYRGKALPQLVGKYIFGDWSGNMAFGDGSVLVATRPAKQGAGEKWTVERLDLKNFPNGKVKAYLWAFGQDADGELYVLSNGANMVSGTRGKVYRLEKM